MKIIIFFLIIIVFLCILGIGDSQNKAEIIGVLDEKIQVDTNLKGIHDTYLEMKQKGIEKSMLAIKLYAAPGSIERFKWAVGISIQFDGTWFWTHIKNDFIPSVYTVGADETFWENKTVGTENVSWEEMNKKIKAYLVTYKEQNADKGDFLDLLQVMHK